mgnify:CR=1 FL=1|tara:strand:- start:352 stop:537 length:186 start_codon:yes stop_codon:yes gene_type:complete
MTMQKKFEGTINHNEINKMSLKQLKLINDILDGKLTEEQKVKRVKELFPNTIKGSAKPINK